MTDCVLPRTESGEVDFDCVRLELLTFRHSDNVSEKQVAILKAIDANARAEERERCARKIEEVGPSDGGLGIVTEGFAHAIRNQDTR